MSTALHIGTRGTHLSDGVTSCNAVRRMELRACIPPQDRASDETFTGYCSDFRSSQGVPRRVRREQHLDRLGW
jgi:hypothetical protein